jgi:hypothetical protein
MIIETGEQTETRAASVVAFGPLCVESRDLGDLTYHDAVQPGRHVCLLDNRRVTW